MSTINCYIDIKNEFSCIIDYLNLKCDNRVIDTYNIFFPVFQQAQKMAKYSFDNLYFYQLLEHWKNEHLNYDNWLKAGSTMSLEEFNNSIQHDKITQFIGHLTIALQRLDFTIKSTLYQQQEIANLTHSIMQQNPYLLALYPTNLANLEFKGHNLVLKKDGIPLHNLYFPDLISEKTLQHYDNIDFNNIYMLADAVFWQIFQCCSDNNNRSIYEELKNLFEHYNNSQYRKTINTSLNVQSQHIILKYLFEIIQHSDHYFPTYPVKVINKDVKGSNLHSIIQQINNRTREEIQRVEIQKNNLKQYVLEHLN